MKFPLNVTKQKQCPVCKKPGAGTKSPVTPRPEVASLSFCAMSFVHGRSYPVFLGSELILGWDSGVSKHPLSRSSLGSAFAVAKKDGRNADASNLEIEFCSTRCLRKFLMEAVDELDRRVDAIKPEVKRAKK